MNNIIPFNRFPSIRKFVFMILSTELCYKQCKRISYLDKNLDTKIENEDNNLTKIEHLKSLINDTTIEFIFFEFCRLIILLSFLFIFRCFLSLRVF